MRHILTRKDYLQQIDENREMRLKAEEESLLQFEEQKETKNISIAELRDRIKKLKGEK